MRPFFFASAILSVTASLMGCGGVVSEGRPTPDSGAGGAPDASDAAAKVDSVSESAATDATEATDTPVDGGSQAAVDATTADGGWTRCMQLAVDCLTYSFDGGPECSPQTCNATAAAGNQDACAGYYNEYCDTFSGS